MLISLTEALAVVRPTVDEVLAQSKLLFGGLALIGMSTSVGRDFMNFNGALLSHITTTVGLLFLLNAYPYLLGMYASVGDGLAIEVAQLASLDNITQRSEEVALPEGEDVSWYDFDLTQIICTAAWGAQVFCYQVLFYLSACAFAVIAVLGPILIAVSVLPVYDYIRSWFNYALQIVLLPIVPGLGMLIATQKADAYMQTSDLAVATINGVMVVLSIASPWIVSNFTNGAAFSRAGNLFRDKAGNAGGMALDGFNRLRSNQQSQRNGNISDHLRSDSVVSQGSGSPENAMNTERATA